MSWYDTPLPWQSIIDSLVCWQQEVCKSKKKIDDPDKKKR